MGWYMKPIWHVIKIKLSVIRSVWHKGKINFDVYVKDNLGNNRTLIIEAWDELDAWREAETHIKELL